MRRKRRRNFRPVPETPGLMPAILALILAAALVVAPGVPGVAAGVTVLKSADIGEWKPKEFSGTTRYEPVRQNGQRVLKAVSDGSASGLYLKRTIDLHKTPLLRWRWRVDNVFSGIDETSRSGDDYPARVYVVAAHPVFFWKTRALTYVWSSSQPRGSTWLNAFTDNARMIAVRSGRDGLKEWHQESRNVREDFRRYFGKDVRYVNAVAIMSDSDNAGGRAVAYYGDISFSSD